MSTQHRHLAAILFTDIVGYTAMMQQDEVRAVQLVNRYLAVLKSTVASHAGKIINDYGDGSLCTFPSAFEALNCAIELQAQLREEPIVPLRIGLHIGEIFFENKKVFGDGVNVASRIQSLGQANAILFSGEMLNKIKNHPEFKPISLGKFDFKNVDEHIEVFALANEGLVVPKRNEMSGKLKEQKKRTLRKNIIIAFASLLVLFLIFFGYQEYSNNTKFETVDNSIAVMAFSDMSPNHDQEYLGDGIAQEILDRLCRFKDLKVTARTSSFYFKGKNEDIREIGKRLNAGHILTGSVRKEGNQIRVNVELINAATRLVIFSEPFNYESKNILSLESDIAVAVAGKIKTILSSKEKELLTNRKEVNPDAYEAYLKGRIEWNKGGLRSNNIKAKQYFETAVALDPAFSEAYAFLSITCSFLSNSVYPLKEKKKALDSAKTYAKIALALNENSSMSHLAMERVYRFEYDWINMVQEVDKALAINPGGSMEKMRKAICLVLLDEADDEGVALAGEAAGLDSLNPRTLSAYAYVLYFAGRYDEAIVASNHILALDSNSTDAFSRIGFCYVSKKEYEKGLEAWSKQNHLTGNHQLAEAYLKSDFKTAIEAWFSYATTERTVFARDYIFANLYAFLRDGENTLKYLDLAYHNNEDFIELKRWDEFDFIRNDSAFIALYDKIGFKKYDEYLAGKNRKLKTHS